MRDEGIWMRKNLEPEFIYLLYGGPTCQCGYDGFAGAGMIFFYP